MREGEDGPGEFHSLKSDAGDLSTFDEVLENHFGIEHDNPVRVGKFETCGWMGQGGQSIVFKAIDPDLHRTVAIKLYHKPLDSIQQSRVLSEGRALARIDSPYVARCYSVDTIAQAPFLVLEWVPGVTLDEYLKSHELNSRSKRELFVKILKGVQALHQTGLIHRDLKPGNILVSEDGEPKIVDLGLVVDPDAANTGIAGTYSYMAPEVVREQNERVGVATDIFGLGGVLYFMLSGQPLFDGKSKREIMERARKCEITSPYELVDGAPLDLSAVCMKCLNEETESRFQNVQQILHTVDVRKRSPSRLHVATGIALALLGLWMGMKIYGGDNDDATGNDDGVAGIPGEPVKGISPKPQTRASSTDGDVGQVATSRIADGRTPGPVFADPPVPLSPGLTSEKSSGIGGASTVFPFPELQSNGSHLDYRVVTTPSSSGCTQSGNGGHPFPGDVPNSLVVNRKLIPVNQVTIGNSSPGMFFVDMDLRLELFHHTDGGNIAILFDPENERTFYLTDPQATGIYSPDAPGFGDLTARDNKGTTAPLPGNTATATISGHDGWKYEFEMAGTAMGVNHFGGRIKTITSPDGFLKKFSYKTFTQVQIDNDPTLQYQIDTITDPSGNVATITYHSMQMASRWVISEISINRGEVILKYDYNTSGHLETVQRNGETISTYTYGIDKRWNAASITWNQRLWNNSQSRDTIYLSSDYLLWDGQQVNQFANKLLGRADGSGHRYMTVTRSGNTPGLFRIEYRGQLVQWQQGSYWRYFSSWSRSGSGFSGYSGTLETTYAHHPGITSLQKMTARPPTLIDETGLSTDARYDARGNIYRKYYDGVSGSDYEQWLYDSNNRVTYYRDRSGFVTLTERNAQGLVLRVTRGHKDIDGDGNSTALAEATQTIYGYYPESHQNAGLMKWMAINAYVAGTVVEPAAIGRTDYIYNASNQLCEVKKPMPQGQATRPAVSYTWSGGQVYTLTDETRLVTTFNRDPLARINETLYPDGSTSQNWWDEANRKSYVKDRNNIVTMTELDSSQRVYSVQRGYGRDPYILDGEISANAWYARHDTVRYYAAGSTQPRKTVIQHASTENDYDYRGRPTVTRRYSGKHTEAVVTSTKTFLDNRLFSISESWPGYSRTTCIGYSPDRLTVRSISTRIPAVSFADNKAVMNATRVAGMEPDFVISDAIHDVRGNLVQSIDGRGTITMNTFDALSRRTQTVRAHGSPMALTSSTACNPRGQVEMTIDPAGMQTRTVYDDAGNIKSSTVGFGTTQALRTSFTYDARGRQKTITSPSGAVTTSHYYDRCGNSSGSEDAYGFGSIRVTNPGGLLVYQASVTDEFDFDSGNFLDPAAEATRGEKTFRYQHDGRVQYMTHWKSARGQINPAKPPIAGVNGVSVAAGLTTQFVYFRSTQFNANNAKLINRLGGGTTTVKVDPAIAKLAEPLARGGADMAIFYSGTHSSSRAQAMLAISPDEKTMKVWIADGLGRTVLSGLMTGPAAAKPNQLVNWTCTQYDQSYLLGDFGHTGRVNQIDCDGNFTSLLFDGFGQRVGSLDQDNHLTRRKFDAGGNLCQRIDANSNSVTFTYDDLGRLLETRTPAGTTTAHFDALNGRINSTVDGRNNTTSYQYDILGRQSTVTDRMGKSARRVYDGAGHLHALTDAQDNTTTHTYDLLGRKVTTTFPDGSGVSNDYDPDGKFPVGSRALKMTYSSGKSKTLIRSFDGTLDKIEYRDSSGTLTGTDDYSYDVQRRRTGSTSMDGIVRALTFNEHGQLASETTIYGGQSYTVSFAYDNRLRQKSITYPSGRVASCTRTNRGELDTITWAEAQIEVRSYNDVGLLTNIDRAFADEVRTYDSSDRLLTVDNPGVGAATCNWDANNNRLGESWTGNMADWSFTAAFDEEDRLRRYIQVGQARDVYLERTDFGSISDVQINGISHLCSSPDAHKRTSVDVAVPRYDADGNLTLTDSGTTLSWNDANRLAGTTQRAVVSDYKSDSDSRRVSRQVTDDGVVTNDVVYIYAGPNCIAEYKYGVADTSPEQEYIYARDSLVLLSRNNNDDRFVVTRNQRRTVTALLDASDGTVQERYTYDHFGKRTVLAPDGTTVRNASQLNMPIGFAGRRHDAESQLIYFPARYYDTTTGAFCNGDPSSKWFMR